MSFENLEKEREEKRKGTFDNMMETGEVSKIDKVEPETKATMNLSISLPTPEKEEKRTSKSYYLKQSTIKKIRKLSKDNHYKTDSAFIEALIESL
ncbi:hypothetical protein [Ligilactobacillus equi]|uniref:Uncharacterized protein n=2 Tax=Ligilactobacillus equi TaxID=137357 RepID=V7HZY7_9LACO|nr:hypothetical protein [Ligilactobacillus equi]ETA74591.1 hypothetical protein LEQ_0456c [Ligilactobacillus equi DPC 6820]KRL81173.1 hypothetical protein FC36_GL002059 [Ligilactobacillus equi DSM 15833 = JCM 10991]